MIRATIYDVAREAGVSIATVSHVRTARARSVANGVRRFSISCAPELSAECDCLSPRRQNLYPGIARPRHLQPLFAEIARSVEDHGHQLGYSVIICDGQPGREGKALCQPAETKAGGRRYYRYGRIPWRVA